MEGYIYLKKMFRNTKKIINPYEATIILNFFLVLFNNCYVLFSSNIIK